MSVPSGVDIVRFIYGSSSIPEGNVSRGQMLCYTNCHSLAFLEPGVTQLLIKLGWIKVNWICLHICSRSTNRTREQNRHSSLDKRLLLFPEQSQSVSALQFMESRGKKERRRGKKLFFLCLSGSRGKCAKHKFHIYRIVRCLSKLCQSEKETVHTYKLKLLH